LSKSLDEQTIYKWINQIATELCRANSQGMRLAKREMHC
jgi:hypothetical protein